MIVNADESLRTHGRGDQGPVDDQPRQAADGLVLGGSYVQHLQVDLCSEDQKEAFVLRRPVLFFEDAKESNRLQVHLDQLYTALDI